MSPENQARIDFVLQLRRRWADRLYPALRRQYEETAKPSATESTAEVVHRLPAWPWFAFIERNSQKALWRAVGDAVAGEPGDGRHAGTRPELAADLRFPEWYTAIDIHLQPGGVWSSNAAARVYELGAKLVMLGENNDYTFHRLFASTAVPEGRYRRIVDLGCGFGKSAWPLKQQFPEAEVIGVDFSAPCLELAAERCAERGLELRLVQADCAATGLDAGLADLVTSTMLIHELPPKHLAATLREAARLLAPGGRLRFLDFHLTGDAFRDLAMREHGERNNEPFMPPLFDTDLERLAAEAGLIHARWVAFDERGKGRMPALEWPERAEWHFPWAVFEAEKPARAKP